MTYTNPSRATWAQNAKRISETFEKWGIGFEDWRIDCDIEPARRNGYHSTPVTVSYRLRGQVVAMTLDSQDTPAKNLSSIAITVEAIRMQERRGLGAIAAAHYLAIAAPVGKRDPHEVLGLRPDATAEEVDAMYRLRAKSAHPDTGGSEDAMQELNEARDLALERIAGGAP